MLQTLISAKLIAKVKNEGEEEPRIVELDMLKTFINDPESAKFLLEKALPENLKPRCGCCGMTI